MKTQNTIPVKLKFPEAEGKYWFLMWIGAIEYQKQRKVELYFYNKKTATDDYRDLDLNCLEKLVRPVSYLSELEIGSIYDISQEKIIKTTGRIYNISIKENIYLAKKSFPLNESKYFLKNAVEIVPIGFNYLKVYPKINELDDATVADEKKKMNILISPYVILQYFLSNDAKLIKKVFSGELLDAFNISKIQYRNCIETGKRIGRLTYDMQKIDEKHAIYLAPFLFLKKSAGIKFLQSVYSNVEMIFINSEEKKTYLNFSWHNFTNYEMEVEGKYYYTGFNNDFKYLHTYRINTFRFKGDNPYIVDKVELFAINSKKTTEDRKNHDPKDVNRPLPPQITGLSLNLNSDSASPIAPVSSKIKGEFDNPFNIEVEVIDRDKQLNAYNVKYFPADKDFEDVVRDQENLENDAERIREEIEKYAINVKKFKYFEDLVNLLKSGLENTKFNIQITSYSNTFLRNYYIAEIRKFNKNLYLVEFGNGIIGVFNKKDFRTMSSEYLFSIVESFLSFKKDVEEGKVLWTYIKNKQMQKYLDEDIIIHTGVKHLNVPEDKLAKTKDEAIKEAVTNTARHIYKNRINSILPK
ncbi:hypothetical protein P2W68_17105 [Chryseobacterium arthrosphaerae]|uniref:hypothetical protein n=1 Tax=Chryseobacterium arthrosphaerae TaxID=651561 RepID=UPI0023E31243|nr:hypothetical protein [Chryseobacterium arthrosphaerae]WES96553.1 hypothetical protein P2W68_17105 [Chryseobacterium arthrosphaerae]